MEENLDEFDYMIINVEYLLNGRLSNRIYNYIFETQTNYHSEYQATIPLATLLNASGKQSGIVIPFGGSSMVDGTLLYQWCVRDDGFIMNSKYSGEHIVFYCVI